VTLGATDADIAASSIGVFCQNDPCSIFQDAHPLGRNSVAPFDGVLARWRIRIFTVVSAVDATTNLRLIGPATSPLAWGAAGPPVDVPNASELPSTISQDIRLPIARGQGIAPQFQNTSGGTVDVAGRPVSGGRANTISPPPPPGGTGNGNISQTDFLLAVAADVETDADRDQFGDETQDGCPTDATTQGPCPPPDPGDVEPPGLSWCGKRKQNVVEAGAVRACVNTSELAAVDATGTLTVGKGGNRARPIALRAAKGGAAPGAKALLDLKLSKKGRSKVDDALDDDKRVSGLVTVTGTDAAGNAATITGDVVAKGG
jgi:hypothetical protein